MNTVNYKAIVVKIICSIALIIFYYLPSTTNAALLYDNFNVVSLDPSVWTVIDGEDGILITEGILEMSDAPNHKRINSLTTFNPSGAGVLATAKININGDYNKFGFNVNGYSNIGMYFDTGTLDDNQDSIRTLIYDPGSDSYLFDETVSLSWGSYHELSIAWLPDSVSFYIDDVLVSYSPLTISGYSPVGIWNDRSSLMQIDYVIVTSVPTPSALILGIIGLGLMPATKVFSYVA